PEASDQVVVHHPHRLHERVADRAADKLEAAALQVLAQGVRFRRPGGDVFARLAGVLFRLAPNAGPQVLVEWTELSLHGQKTLRVLHGGVDLQPVADDARVRQQAISLSLRVFGDDTRLEVGKSGSIVIALLENRLPAQTGLGAFEDEEFEQEAV